MWVGGGEVIDAVREREMRIKDEDIDCYVVNDQPFEGAPVDTRL